MTDLAASLADCPRRNASMAERCDVYFPGLIKIMVGDEPPATHRVDNGDDDDY